MVLAGRPLSHAESIVGDHPLELVGRGFEFTEGPVWRPDSGDVVFSDIPPSRLYRWAPGGTPEVWIEPTSKTNGNALDLDGSLLSCEHQASRVVRRRGEDSLEVVADEFDGRELNSPNDIVVDSHGRIYFTDPPFGRTEARMGLLRPLPQEVRGVYVVDEGTVSLLVADIEEPNGLCLSLAEDALFVNDTATNRILRYELRGGRASGGTVWATVSGDGPGSADGMKIDALGNLYCTGPGGVHVFAADGRLAGVIAVPEAVGNFTWVGEGLRRLFICASEAVYTRVTRTPGR